MKRDQDPNAPINLCEDLKTLKAMSPAERRLYSGEREDHRFDGLDPDAEEDRA